MSRTSLGLAVAASLAFGGLAISTAPASAAPMIDPGVARTTDAGLAKPEQVRWVCNRWGRCVWRRNYWGPRVYYGPRFYGGGYARPWGWRHRGYGWRHHRRW